MKPFPTTGKKIYTVSEINRLVKLNLEENYSNIWLLGEISNFKTSPAGHYYFTLKDLQSQIRAVMFRNWNQGLRFIPQDGLMVEVRGTLSIYEARGEYQITIDYMQPKGIGALQLAFEQLKERLYKEGLFDPKNKKPLPFLPKKIGIITSPRGAAIRDILQIINRRFPNVEILIYPTQVQGEEAAGQIAEAIDYMNRSSNVDVLILTRGGGSLEDLCPFNEEIVARRIYHSNIPIISAVGHEIDFTIADFVADVRAPTPSAAAELVIKSKLELEEKLYSFRSRIISSIQYSLQSFFNQLQSLKHHHALRLPAHLIMHQQQYLDELTWRLREKIKRHLTESTKRFMALRGNFVQKIPVSKIIEQSQKFGHLSLLLQEKMKWNFASKKILLVPLSKKLETLSPRTILERGYSICTGKGSSLPLKKAEQVNINDEVKVILSMGELGCQVKKISPKYSEENDGKKEL